MKLRHVMVGAASLLAAGCASGGSSAQTPPAAEGGAAPAGELARVRAEAAREVPRPATRAERSGYMETSRHADVVAFLDTLSRMDGRLNVTLLGRSSEARNIPIVIASRPRVSSPAEARRLGRPVVWVQGNIHAGEVEGKEALLMLLRDLALDPKPNVLDSLVLLAVPIYNADGNEKVGPQARQRGSQNGPELVGQRPNAQGLDLNRDYMKAEAPETRAALAAFREWDPDVFVDLHTTNGSYHGYQLTWSPSLHPAAPLRAFNQDTLLPALQQRVRERRGVPTFPYGNFGQDERGNGGLTDTLKQGWLTYDHRPRFGTNYYGLRGRLSILSEAYSHDPFETRVRATYGFVRELLSQLGETWSDAGAREARFRGTSTAGVLRAKLTDQPVLAEVISEDLVRTGDSSRTQPGVPLGLRRTGNFRTQRMPVVDRFVATRTATVPAAGWLLDAREPGMDSVMALLRRHGVEVRHAPGDQPFEVEIFRVDSIVRAERPFQGHREVRLEGTWRRETRTATTGFWYVRPAQRHALLALHLLEPESDDGVAAWNFLDTALAVGRDYPVIRVHGAAQGR